MTGTTLSHYKIVEELGRGGMGIVYLGEDTKLDRKVAIKVLPSSALASDDDRARFYREAKAAAALNHPNIAQIYQIDDAVPSDAPHGTQPSPFIAMEYIDGEPLDDRIKRGPLELAEAVRLATQIAGALGEAHEKGIVHRDVKASNVMLTSKGDAKVLDFGLALTEASTKLTRMGSTLGTVAYMSPEQARGDAVDHRTDIWAFGVVLYEMLTGQRPFESTYDQAIVYSILNVEPPPIREVNQDVPERISALVSTCLEKDRSDRIGTMADVVAELQNVDSSPEQARSDSDARPERFPRAAVVVGTLALLSVIIVSLVLLNARKESDDASPENRVAVLPFSISGADDLSYLGEGMVDLLSEKLNGAGELRTIDPRVVIALLKRENLDARDPEDAVRAAELLGAGRFVAGDVLQLGDRLRLTAYAHDAGEPGESLSTSTFEGTESELLPALDGVASTLLSGMLTGPSAEIQRTAASSSSLAAVKEYLKGEQAMREGRYREASEAYRRATEIDSTFALAYYRNSLVAEWIDAPDVRALADRAMEFSDQLPDRERSLLQALHLRRNGWPDQAERAYRAHLTRYLDDIEALVQLGEILFHEHPRKGRPIGPARSAFGRVVALEPGNLNARIHLARLEGVDGNFGGLVEHAEAFRMHGSSGERAVEVDAILAYATGDSSAQQKVLESIRSSPFYYTIYAVHGVIRYARDVYGAEEVLNARPTDDRLLLTFIPQIRVQQGRFAEVREYLRSSRDQRDPAWDQLEAFILTSGAVEADGERVETLLRRMETVDPEETRSASFFVPTDDITLDFMEFENRYFRALLLSRLGRNDEAEALLEEMRSVDELPGMGSLPEDVMAEIEAEIAFTTGRQEQALEHLRRIRYDVEHSSTIRMMVDGTRSRFLRAELEYAIGDRATALDFYRGLDESWSPFDSFYRGPVYLRLAEIAENDGRLDDAILNYTRLLHMWRDADPVLNDVRASARNRLDVLIQRRDSEPADIPAA
ncbi:MAG: protein kinase [Rhodothermales bacterium]|nr:protein kinase [Rhodothermales bacterium]